MIHASLLRAQAAVDDLKKHPVTPYALRRAYESLKGTLKAQALPLDWPARGRFGLPSAYGPTGWPRQDDDAGNPNAEGSL